MSSKRTKPQQNDKNQPKILNYFVKSNTAVQKQQGNNIFQPQKQEAVLVQIQMPKAQQQQTAIQKNIESSSDSDSDFVVDEKENDKKGCQQVHKKVQNGDTQKETPRFPTQKDNKPQQFQQQQQQQMNEKHANPSVQTCNQMLSIEVNQSDFDEEIPMWAQREHCRDANKHPSTSALYDSSTLFIPENAFNKFTPTMKQFWNFKRSNFDKVIFFKLGKFYELFYEDACIGNKYLDLKWMGRKMHTGFPEKALDKYASQLVALGFKVAVVEQMETPLQMEERRNAEAQKGRKSEKTVQRDIVELFTKGTFHDANQTQTRVLQGTDYVANSQYDPSERYLLSMFILKSDPNLKEHAFLIGLAFLESATNRFRVLALDDDCHLTRFKTLICQTRPLEVVLPLSQQNHRQILSILRGAGGGMPQLSPLAENHSQWHNGHAINILQQKYFPTNSNELQNQNQCPALIKSLLDSAQNNFGSVQDESSLAILHALSGCFNYLQSILLFDKVLYCATFQNYNETNTSNMVLDSQALQHLEVLETQDATLSQFNNNKSIGSLFNCIDSTSTPFGKRLLRKWLCAPLYNVDRINDRLDAVTDLSRLQSERRAQFRKRCQYLGDIERCCARLYQYSVKQSKKAVYFEDVSGARLRELRGVIEKFRDMIDIIVQTFQVGIDIGAFKSQRLRRLVAFRNADADNQEDDEYDDGIFNNTAPAQETGWLPDIKVLLQKLEDMIEWKAEGKGLIIQPKPGVMDEYDAALTHMSLVEKQFQSYLGQIRNAFGNHTIDYSHAIHEFQLELPDKCRLSNLHLMNDWELMGKRAGFQRYHTPEIKKLLTLYTSAQSAKKLALQDFSYFIFSKFHDYYQQWDRFIQIFSELDCFMSLSQFSFNQQMDMCRPILYDCGDASNMNINNERPNNSGPFMEARGAWHPQLATNLFSSKRQSFVPNDILLGNYDMREGHASDQTLLLLSGPNMGGKSTILRLSCVIGILAQLGCYVPARSCRLSLIDRIFTRIGGSDKLTEGKSTFFIEMEETLNILKTATSHSLAIVDELGRGTSTFDGVGIAYSVLKYFIERISCRILFATHYHVLMEEFRMYRQIQYMHMAVRIDGNSVIFLYKLVHGCAEQSFGMNVARVAGVPASIIQLAQEKAEQFQENMNFHKINAINKKFNSIIDGMLADQNSAFDQFIEEQSRNLDNLKIYEKNSAAKQNENQEI